MIVPRPFIDMLEIAGVPYAAVLSDIVAKRDLHVTTKTDVFTKAKLPSDHAYKFRSNSTSNSGAYCVFLANNLNSPFLDDLPTFAGVHDGTDLTIGFIDFGDARYIVKGDRVEIVLLKKTLPVVVMQGLRDMPLHDVIAHPMMRPGRSIVAKARESGNSIALDCSSDLVEIDPDGMIIREI